MDYKLLTKPSSATKRQKRVLARSMENSIFKFKIALREGVMSHVTLYNSRMLTEFARSQNAILDQRPVVTSVAFNNRALGN